MIRNRDAARAARRASAVAKINAAHAQEIPVVEAAPEAPKPGVATLADAAKPVEVKPAESAKPVEMPATPVEDETATKRGLAQIEHARKRFLDEQNAAKAELEVQRAEIARLRKEAEGRVASREELKKLSPTELLDALDHWTEDDHDILSRAAYARTKAGKTDPRAQAAAQEASRAQSSRVAQAEVAQLKETIEELRAELRGEFTKRDQMSFAERWVGEAIKSIPTDKPTFIAKLHANEPDTARRELILIGAELEKANDGEPPTQAEVLAEFENRKRAQLKALGLDADALLAPKPTAPATTKPAARTLDVGATQITRPENAPQSREERRVNALAKLRMRQRQTADQVS